jgi:hypothetical protein
MAKEIQEKQGQGQVAHVSILSYLGGRDWKVSLDKKFKRPPSQLISQDGGTCLSTHQRGRPKVGISLLEADLRQKM